MTKTICYLICVFNDQEGLDKSLASIYKDDALADILVVDDGSTPPARLLSTPNGFKTTLLPLKDNVGLIDALNAGLSCLTELGYTYIARLDAGDTVEKGRLKAQSDYLESNPDIGLLGTNLRAFDKESDKTLFYFNNPTGAKAVKNILKIKNCIAHPSVMVRSAVFKNVGFYDPDFKHAEDYEMWRRIEKQYGVDNLSGVFVNKEITHTQITAINRQGSSLSRLRSQLKYFEILNVYCWMGVARTLIALILPRRLLLYVRSKLFSKNT